MDRRTGAVIVSTISILIVTFLVILYARGYRPDLQNNTLEPTGILVATSDPDGAEVYVNNKLATATNTTINFPPGSYQVKISKDGYWDWTKNVTIKKEEVFKTNAFLFPKTPDLRPLTFSGTTGLYPAPSGQKVAYFVATGSATTKGVWITEMTGIPLVSNGSSRLIYKGALKIAGWSFDERQLVASNSAGTYYLLDADRNNDQPTIITITQLQDLKNEWQDAVKIKLAAQLSKLDKQLLSTLSLSAANFRFSPDESKFIYTATASANLLAVLPTQLPGTNPTPEVRKLSPGNIYTYDIKEDKNYLLFENFKFQISNLSWFSTSRHLAVNEGQQISVMEFDGANKVAVYAGPFVDNFVFPWPGSTKIVILTSLNPNAGVDENMYTINLR